MDDNKKYNSISQKPQKNKNQAERMITWANAHPVATLYKTYILVFGILVFCLGLLFTACIEYPAFDTAPPDIVLVAPEDEFISELTYISFSWETVTHAVKYELWIINGDKTYKLVEIGPQEETISFTADLDLMPPEYEWWVRVYKRLRYFDSSEHRSFTIVDEILPTLEFSQPYEYYTLLNNTLQLTGTASDNEAVARVELQLEGGEVIEATTENWPIKTGAWSAQLDCSSFKIGQSFTVTATVYDTSENSQQYTRTFVKGFNKDINGDDIPDTIIGSPYSYIGGINSGRFSVVYGGSSIPSYPDVVLDGDASGERLGTSVSHAGDVNNDGYNDVIVGASKNGANGTSAGKVYIYYGGETLDTTADVVIENSDESDYLGCSVAGLGDVNGDGFDDVIVGAYGANNSGRAYIYFGGASMDGTPDVTLEGESSGDYFGMSVSYAGDIDGDGTCDALVGAPLFDDTLGNEGAVYVFLGGSSMDSEYDYRYIGGDNNATLGYAVSGGYDLNSDGTPDIAAGAPQQAIVGPETGAVYIYFGGTESGSTSSAIISGTKQEAEFGRALELVGDTNLNGYADILVGAHLQDDEEMDQGVAYLYYGGETINSNPGLTIREGEKAADEFGLGVTGCGDINADGYADFVIGAYKWDGDDGPEIGKIYYYYGGAVPENEAWGTILGYGAWGRFGASLH